MGNLLEMVRLSCGYGNKVILKDINLKLNHGEILGIIGPNGSGKTTLFRVITKIIEPVSGFITFEHKDLKKISHKELAKKIAFVSQNLDVDLKIPVIDFVLLGRIPHRKPFKFFEEDEDLQIAHAALSLTELSYAKDEPLAHLSGGEKQLAQITKALAQEPKLLLLDEPTSHLDIGHQVKILGLLKRLNRERGLTEMVVFHDLNMASEFCDRLVLLSEGKIIKDGTPKEVLSFENIEAVYNTVVIVKENPLSSKPYVFPVFEKWRK